MNIVKKLNRIKKLFQIFLVGVNKQVDNSGSQVLAFGIFGVINYPLFYFIWHYIAVQPYTDIATRMIAGAMCLLLVLRKFWPVKLRPFFPFYWYLTLLYCLPFFGTYLLLKNQCSESWLLNFMLVIFLLILVVDWLSFTILLLIGITLGSMFYYLTGGTFVPGANMVGPFSTYIWAILIAAIFSMNRAKLEKAKFQGMRAAGASIAHELRTPLAAIRATMVGLEKYLPKLVESYQAAKANGLNVPLIRSDHYESLNSAISIIDNEVKQANIFIDMLLVNINKEAIYSKKFVVFTIRNCIQKAIDRYPFTEDQKTLIKWKDSGKDFEIKGVELFVIHILFNLFKNALYAIQKAGKGEIEIWLSEDKLYNKLHIKDTGAGIDSKDLPHIFNQFYSKTQHGTGIGLAFSKMVMAYMGGNIECKSILGIYAEFVLSFPK